MTDTITAHHKTNLDGKEVIVKAIHFFTSERWRLQSQSESNAVFVGKTPIPWGFLVLEVMGFFFFIIPGIILYILVAKKFGFQNIVVSIAPINEGTDVSMTFSKSAKKLVQQFLITLPSASSLQNPDLN